MSGLFGLFDYEKEGPGISKDAPKKKTFVIFFETFLRNFWKFISINLIHSIISLPIVTSGLATVGITNVTRNIARDKHSFGLSDYFETIKKNWKQALPAGIINILAYMILIFDFYFFMNTQQEIIATIGMGLSLAFFLIFTFMNYFIWTLIITFKFTLKQVYKNSFKFAFINLKKNFICFFILLLVNAIYIGIAVATVFLLPKFSYLVILIELIVYTLTYHAFKFLIVQYCVFPSIKKYIIDPYYREHPDEDIEKRRDLGINIEEDTPESIEEEENPSDEDPEIVFND